jgi:hypothetical protein
VTDRDVTRRGPLPNGSRAGRPDWWSASAPDVSDGAGAGAGAGPRRARGPGQADGWTNPAAGGSRPSAYGDHGSPAYGGSAGNGSTLPQASRASSGPYGGAPGFSANRPSVPSNYPGPTDARPGSPGAYGGSGGGYGASDATQVQGGSPGWAPPRSGAYGGASAPTQVQGGPSGWAPPHAANAAPPLAPPTTPQNPGWPPSPPPGPAFAPSGQGYGAPPDRYGGPSGPPPVVGPTVVRHRPGFGLVLGLAGAIALVVSLTMLPWISEGGEDASFSDIREIYENVDDLTESPLTGGAGSTPAPTTPPGSSLDPTATSVPPDGGGSLGQPVAPSIPTADEVADTAETTGKNAYLEFYTKWGWIGVLVALSVAVLFTTLVVPSNKAGRMLTGFLMAGFIGLGLNAADDEGGVAPKICGALATLVAAGLHGAAIWALFSEDLAPDPAVGVWAGAGGLAIVFVGCIVGTRRERVNAAYG